LCCSGALIGLLRRHTRHTCLARRGTYVAPISAGEVMLKQDRIAVIAVLAVAGMLARPPLGRRSTRCRLAPTGGGGELAAITSAVAAPTSAGSTSPSCGRPNVNSICAGRQIFVWRRTAERRPVPGIRRSGAAMFREPMLRRIPTGHRRFEDLKYSVRSCRGSYSSTPPTSAHEAQASPTSNAQPFLAESAAPCGLCHPGPTIETGPFRPKVFLIADQGFNSYSTLIERGASGGARPNCTIRRLDHRLSLSLRRQQGGTR
jgi:hypothetical protein